MLDMINNAKPEELEEILQAVLVRYRELYPGWEIVAISLEKAGDKNEQLDRIIGMLEIMKEK